MWPWELEPLTTANTPGGSPRTETWTAPIEGFHDERKPIPILGASFEIFTGKTMDPPEAESIHQANLPGASSEKFQFPVELTVFGSGVAVATKESGRGKARASKKDLGREQDALLGTHFRGGRPTKAPVS